MPFLRADERRGFCPYCIEGEIEFDKYSNRLYCGKCNNAISCPELTLFLQKKD